MLAASELTRPLEQQSPPRGSAVARPGSSSAPVRPVRLGTDSRGPGARWPPGVPAASEAQRLAAAAVRARQRLAARPPGGGVTTIVAPRSSHGAGQPRRTVRIARGRPRSPRCVVDTDSGPTYAAGRWSLGRQVTREEPVRVHPAASCGRVTPAVQHAPREAPPPASRSRSCSARKTAAERPPGQSAGSSSGGQARVGVRAGGARSPGRADSRGTPPRAGCPARASQARSTRLVPVEERLVLLGDRGQVPPAGHRLGRRARSRGASPRNRSTYGSRSQPLQGVPGLLVQPGRGDPHAGRGRAEAEAGQPGAQQMPLAAARTPGRRRRRAPSRRSLAAARRP